MRFLFKILLISFFCSGLQIFFPWWSIALAAFFVSAALKSKYAILAFLEGFLGVGLLWLAYTFYIDNNTNSILSNKIVQLFPYIDTPLMLIVFSALVGGLVGAMSSLSGHYLRSIFEKQDNNVYRRRY